MRANGKIIENSGRKKEMIRTTIIVLVAVLANNFLIILFPYFDDVRLKQYFRNNICKMDIMKNSFEINDEWRCTWASSDLIKCRYNIKEMTNNPDDRIIF